ncbi:hypothetical protein CTEN210_04201 [Chaetoceros tenuissimus]|uniref:PDZ domain-containing protein n=1 Tax=Chaetoceros tenuissimus TaxID=426638 RepID=A0AAD3CKR2_9STRA|nr:hypothetical protein CTEN210_04201 [Chaetoceros tenuissimus]
MKGFFDKLNNNKKNEKEKPKNPFSAIQSHFEEKKQRNNRGGGKSLGGSKPGSIIPKIIVEQGSIGVTLENTKEGSAIVASVGKGSQAASIGLQRGDIICFSGSNGESEIPYKLFLEMVKSSQRPLEFEIRRIELKHQNSVGGGRADAEAKRQAVIAAAEARDKSNKIKKKPISKARDLTAEQKKKIEEQREALAKKNETYMSNTPLSAEAQKAVELAKKDEQKHVEKLGYNPYETMKGTGTQASTAVTNINHGSIQSSKAESMKSSSSNGPSTGAKTAPSSSSAFQQQSIHPEFDDAFTAIITTQTDQASIQKSLRIMRKLIHNAIQPNQSLDKKKVRISNPNKHIDAAINQMHGAVDIMMSVGFVLLDHEEDGETYLMFTSDEAEGWVHKALEQMEAYENTL